MVTIKDVAKKAGVSPATVSRSLRDSTAISQKTKERVRKAMKDLGYVPNIAAKMLATRLTHAVGVVFPPVTKQERHSQPFNMEILEIINQEAMKNGYTISIALGSSPKELQEQIKRMYAEKRVDGFLVLYSMADDPAQAYLRQEKIPFVILGTPAWHENEATYVDNDNELMGRTAVDYLLENGHKDIIFVTDDLASELYLRRYQGYQMGLITHGLQSHEAFLFDRTNPVALEDMYDYVREHKVTACIVIDDMTALRVSQFFTLRGLKVPDELSLVSFNDSPYATLIHPYLTSFDINVASLGRLSFERLLVQIKEASSGGEKILVPFNLKKRESVRNLLAKKAKSESF